MTMTATALSSSSSFSSNNNNGHRTTQAAPSSLLGNLAVKAALAASAVTTTSRSHNKSSTTFRNRPSPVPMAAKGNDGGRSRQRCQRKWTIRIVLFGSLFVVAYHLLWKYWLAGVFVPEFEYVEEDDDESHGGIRKKTRRHPDQLYKVNPETSEKIPTDFIDGILEGYLTLVDISLPVDGLESMKREKTSDEEDHDGGDEANEDKDEDYLKIPHSYKNVHATFCHIAWNLQERDVTQVPLFRDLQQLSPLCAATKVEHVDFYTIVQKAKAYDQYNHGAGIANDYKLNFTATTPKKGHQVVSEPTAVIFHETRSGSTLVSNMVASSLPQQVRSYSESTPPLVALMACDLIEAAANEAAPEEARLPECEHESQLQLIRDVFYMMGRVTRPQHPQYMFYKIQSIGVRYIHLLREAVPSVPWAFVFRDSVEILMSHFKDYQTTARKHEKYVKTKSARSSSSKSSSSSSSSSWWSSFWGDSAPEQKDGDTEKDGRPVCLRSYGKADQDPILMELVDQHQKELKGRGVLQLTPEEYCAAHLASLAQSAVIEYHRINGNDNSTPKHPLAHKMKLQWFLNYNQLPHVIWEEWLPVVLHKGMTSEIIKRMQHASNFYAKRTSPNVVDSKRKKMMFGMNKKKSDQEQQFEPLPWQEDSTLKQARAPESIRKAAHLFMEPIYQRMQEIADTQHAR